MLNKGYMFYMDGILFPIPPSKINTKFKNKNKVITLINEGEFNILKEAGLQEISFDMTIPAFKYPFAQYIGGIFLPIKYYLTILEKLKSSRKPFKFIIIREGTLGTIGFDTCLKVSLEDWQIKEDAGNGRDIVISIRLKEYKETNKTIISLIENNGIITKVRDSSSKVLNKIYTVKEGDSLFTIAKKELGDGAKYRELISKNKLANSNSISPGQVISLE